MRFEDLQQETRVGTRSLGKRSVHPISEEEMMDDSGEAGAEDRAQTVVQNNLDVDSGIIDFGDIM